MDTSTAIVVGLLALLQLVARSPSDGKVDRIPAVANDLHGPWISEMFHQALANFTIRHVGNSTCQLQSDMYDRHLRNHTSWAVRSEYIHYIFKRLFSIIIIMSLSLSTVNQ